MSCPTIARSNGWIVDKDADESLLEFLEKQYAANRAEKPGA